MPARAQAAVVGLSARADAVERLEKRVKSRFSHRREQLLELDAQQWAGEAGPPALLAAMLRLPDQARSSQACWGPCVVQAPHMGSVERLEESENSIHCALKKLGKR